MLPSEFAVNSKYASLFVVVLGLLALLLNACSDRPGTDHPDYSTLPASGYRAPGDSVALARQALQQLRSATIVGLESPAVLEAMVADPADYACDNDPLCTEFLAEAGNYAAAYTTFVAMGDTFAADAAVGLSLLADPTKVSNFLSLPPGGIANNAGVGWEPRPLAAQTPLPFRLTGTDTTLAALTLPTAGARLAEQLFLARATGGNPSATVAKAAGVLLARYATMIANP